jgi:hypothetical protein
VIFAKKVVSLRGKIFNLKLYEIWERKKTLCLIRT